LNDALVKKLYTPTPNAAVATNKRIMLSPVLRGHQRSCPPPLGFRPRTLPV
jgi:hypothetical protein